MSHNASEPKVMSYWDAHDTHKCEAETPPQRCINWETKGKEDINLTDQANTAFITKDAAARPVQHLLSPRRDLRRQTHYAHMLTNELKLVFGTYLSL